MQHIKKTIAATLAAGALVTGLSACGGPTDTDAEVASENLSTAAEQFEINRRIAVINTITDTYLWSVEGKCSIDVDEMESQLEVTCKLKSGDYVKHFAHLADNVTYMAEQTSGAAVSTDQYRVIFKPEALVPNFDRP